MLSARMLMSRLSAKVGKNCGEFFEMIQPLLATGRNTPRSIGRDIAAGDFGRSVQRSWTVFLQGSHESSSCRRVARVDAGTPSARRARSGPRTVQDRRDVSADRAVRTGIRGLPQGS